jgi:hypothetical protein
LGPRGDIAYPRVRVRVRIRVRVRVKVKVRVMLRARVRVRPGGELRPRGDIAFPFGGSIKISTVRDKQIKL